MPNKVKVENLYRTTVTSSTAIPASGDFTFDVAVAPQNKNGFLILGSENISTRQIFYYHDVIGNTIYVRGINRITAAAIATPSGYSVKMNDVAELFNYYGDNISTLFYVEKMGGLVAKVWGGYLMYNNNQVLVADTTLTLTDGTTNYIKYDAPTNTIYADTIALGNIKCEVVCYSGYIVSISYRISKESYLDFAISITGALPSQGGNAGKFLGTDGTNVSWQSIPSQPNASTTVAGKVELATVDEVISGSSTGGTGASIVLSPDQLSSLYYFGDGRDGDVTISTNTSLTRDMYYNNLIVNTGIILDPAGFAIYVKGTLTLTGTAKIARNGNAGGNGITNGTGGTAGAALATGTCGPCAAGVVGSAGFATGKPGVSINPSYGNSTGAAGGATGNGLYAGGVGGTSTRGQDYYPFLSLSKLLTYFMSPSRGRHTPTQYGGLAGAGSGGCNDDSSARGGGGSGSSGGIIFIYANILSGTGTIEANGGNGGNGGTGINPNQAGSGGGGGGSGGIVCLLYHSGTAFNISVNGGIGGTGGAGAGSGPTGFPGGNGPTGITFVLQI